MRISSSVSTEREKNGTRLLCEGVVRQTLDRVIVAVLQNALRLKRNKCWLVTGTANLPAATEAFAVHQPWLLCDLPSLKQSLQVEDQVN